MPSVNRNQAYVRGGACRLLLPLAAMVALLPLMIHGCSCGHDSGFHFESWLDAAQQLRHGTLDPQWAFAPAWNSGEPRFVFYPPLSWLLGAVLMLLFPMRVIPEIFTWIVLSAAGLSMFAVARRFVATRVACIVAALYLANPYMLFTAIERTAYGELLAAVWMPWLFWAVLRRRPTAAGVALPFALLWLSDVPAAMLGSYTFALLALLRIAFAALARRREHARVNMHEESLASASASASSVFKLVGVFVGGTLLGLMLPAFYLLPAIWQRRFVQVDMAVGPGLNFDQGFLFEHTGNAAHDAVLHSVSLIAIALMVASVLFLLLCFFPDRFGSRRRKTRAKAPMTLHEIPECNMPASREIAAILAFLLLVVFFFLEPPSASLWRHLPEMSFVQFPWRLLMVLSVVCAFALALLLNRVAVVRRRWLVAVLITFAAVAALGFGLDGHYIQFCSALNTPQARALLFRAGHGAQPTDEYTPQTADNDYLRSDDPAFWLATSPDAYAPRTIPNPNADTPDVDFGLPPPSQTLAGHAPTHLQLNLSAPAYLVLNLRDYPRWIVMRHVPGSRRVEYPAHLGRDDGLIAIALPAGSSIIDIHWRNGWDRAIGIAISLCALLVWLLLVTSRRGRALA